MAHISSSEEDMLVSREEPALEPLQPHPTESSSPASTLDVSTIVAEEIQKARLDAAKDRQKRSDMKRKRKETKEKRKTAPKVSLFGLFQFATWQDRIMIAFASLFAAANGAVMPVMTIIFSGMITVFTDYEMALIQQQPNAEMIFRDGVNTYSIYFLILAAFTFVVGYLQLTLWMIAGERQCKRIRELYFKALMKQRIEFFDKKSTGTLTSRLTGDIALIQDGISERVGFIIQAIAGFISGFVIAFIQSISR